MRFFNAFFSLVCSHADGCSALLSSLGDAFGISSSCLTTLCGIAFFVMGPLHDLCFPLLYLFFCSMDATIQVWSSIDQKQVRTGSNQILFNSWNALSCYIVLYLFQNRKLVASVHSLDFVKLRKDHVCCCFFFFFKGSFTGLLQVSRMFSRQCCTSSSLLQLK